MTRLCLLTPSADYGNPWQQERDDLVALLGRGGIDVATLSWDQADPGALAGHALVLPLLAWPYVSRAERWFALLDAWQHAGLPVLNPPALLRWNSDKAYLLALAADGVATVPTVMAAALAHASLAAARARWGCGSLVIKPPVSAGAMGTALLSADDPIPPEALSQPMLVQPLMPAISSEGEYSLFLFDGALSHAILKRPAAGDFRVQAQFGGREVAVIPPSGALDLAKGALASACRLAGVNAPPLYARIDMVRDPDGRLAIMELELIEPSLFLHLADDGGDRFAQAVSSRLNVA